MKTALVVLMALIATARSQNAGRTSWVGPTVQFHLIDAQPSAPKTKDPLRQIGDTIYQINGESLTNGFVRFYGKVVGVQSGGIRVQGAFTGFGYGYEDGADFFVANFPYEIADGDSIGFDTKNGLLIAKVAGIYTYMTVIGSSRSIRKLDYGQIYYPPPPPELTPEQIAAQKALEQKKKKATAESTIKWLRQQADAGDAFSQYRLGERYLKGDGVETNQTIAREYLMKASAQGNQDARDLLTKSTK